jgi:D-glycero-alpha-D-manno-heptose-7-phosphate kinase
LGSSGAYTVGLLNALHAHQSSVADPERLSREACEIEIGRCLKPIGKQDQYIAAYGGLQYIQFNPDGSVYVDPVTCPASTKRRLEGSLLLLYTGLKRGSDDILTKQIANTRQSAQHRIWLSAMAAMAGQMRTALMGDDLDAVSGLLHEGWMRKRRLVEGISNPLIDEWYDIARRHGATGGKLLGAGGGGFLLICAPPEAHDAIIGALPALRRVPFQFERQGSKIVFVESDDG